MIYSATGRVAEMILRLRARTRGGQALRERLVIDAPPQPATIWVHAASVGELTSAGSVIAELARDFAVIVTANTVTGRDRARGWGMAAQLAPLDMPGPLHRFLDAVRPALMITVEGEFWPLRSRLLAERGIRQTMIGARMSERSAASWARFPRLITPILSRLSAVSAQDADSERRLRALGLRPDRVLPRLDLKLLAPAGIVPPPDDAARGDALLASSTHQGEDAPILDAFVRLRRTHPQARLILAIRHPARGDEVAALIAARGLPVLRRSQGAGDGPVLLVDTLGEMARWYDRAGVCLTGGSLVDHGGHTPWEPAGHRCALLHGPHVGNFTDAYRALDEAGASRTVTADGLAETWAALMARPDTTRAMGAQARHLLTDRAGDPAGLIACLGDLAKCGPTDDMKAKGFERMGR